ncbi:Protein KBP homolog, related [Neospora caninum Liverpool]|uniref:KIF-binding protein n=1 Tax=Neospora caninum (strain Liverpool) TaxID=572307 RepID=F0VJW2_NEOCL|nr:Protein KBP homolog, related [Neospora caninum Liverpool]CBZ54024.1 Protein KBP homolog, related [Neospora caninum Liverpool]|eukprot:XP_003884055.1 Protein KBP homolog, related [Neospora caninum Liverpool]
MADIGRSPPSGGKENQSDPRSSSASALPKVHDELGDDEQRRKAAESLRLLRALFFPSSPSVSSAPFPGSSVVLPAAGASAKGGDECQAPLTGREAPEQVRAAAAREENGENPPPPPFLELSHLMRETVSKYRSILRREEAGHPLDPDEEEAVEAALCAVQSASRQEGEEREAYKERRTRGRNETAELPAPFRPKYAGRRLLQKTAQDLYRAYRVQRERDTTARSADTSEPPVDAPESASTQSLLCLAHLYGLLGQNYINTEETQEGERRLRKSVEIIMRAAALSLPPAVSIFSRRSSVWAFLLFSPAALRVRAALALLDLAGLYTRWQRGRDARSCLSRAAPLLALAERDLEVQETGRETRPARAESSSAKEQDGRRTEERPERSAEREMEAGTQGTAKEETRQAAHLLRLVIHSLRFLQRCISAQVRLLPLEGEDGLENGESASPEEAAHETCGAMAELLEKRARVLERAREREQAERRHLAAREALATEEGRAAKDASLRKPGGGISDAPLHTAATSSPRDLFNSVFSSSGAHASPRSSVSLPGLVFTFFAFTPFVIDTKEIVRNLLSLATFYGFTSLSAPPRACEGRGLVSLFSAEYILETAECLVEAETKRVDEMRLLREARRQRAGAGQARGTSGAPESDKLEAYPGGSTGAEGEHPRDPSDSEEEEVDREGGEITARICRLDARALDELLAEVHRDKSLLYARRLRLSRDVLADPSGLLDPLVRRHEPGDRAAAAARGAPPSRREGETADATKFAQNASQTEESRFFADLIGKQTTQFPPVLEDAQDCLALLSLPEAFLAHKLLSERATMPEGADGGEIESSDTESAKRLEAPDGRMNESEGEKGRPAAACNASSILAQPRAPPPASGLSVGFPVSASCSSSSSLPASPPESCLASPGFFSLSLEAGAALLLGDQLAGGSRDRGCSGKQEEDGEVTLWRPARVDDDRLVRLTDDLYVRCAVRFAPVHCQVAKKMRKMNHEFLQSMDKLDNLHPALLPYTDFISKHLMALALCDDFAAPRCLFVMAQHEAQAALKTFVLDGWTTEHTRLIIHQAALYKELSFFENDVQRYTAMHSRRAKLLASLVMELNPQHYLDLVRQMHFELGETYKEIYDIKWTGQINKDAALLDDDVAEMDPEVVQREEVARMRKSAKLHGYAERSVAHFSAFTESFQKEYEWLRNFLAQREAELSDSFLLRQLSLCEQTLQLLPLRISKLAALGR